MQNVGEQNPLREGQFFFFLEGGGGGGGGGGIKNIEKKIVCRAQKRQKKLLPNMICVKKIFCVLKKKNVCRGA